jgi:hypothetical protein
MSENVNNQYDFFKKVNIDENGNIGIVFSENTSPQPFEFSADNYTALTSATGMTEGNLAYVYNAEGTAWLPGTIGGTYYPSGVYVYNGSDWVSSRDGIAYQFYLDDARLDALEIEKADLTGATFTGTIDAPTVSGDIVQLRGGVGTQGEMSWSADEETVQLIMDGTTLFLGQDTFVHVRNNTASIITKGTAVYATGTLGSSGRITVAPMIADGTIPGRLFIGLAAEDIAIGVDGQVCSYGKIRNINTTTYNDGDVLWLSPTIAGELTATEPVAPNLKIATAFVVHDANNGTLMVRAEQGTDLHSDRRVQVSGLTNNDVLTWNNANQRWENKAPKTTQQTTSTATLTINSDLQDLGIITAQAAALTIAAPTGTPIQGQKLIFRIKDNGTARGITWNAIFRALGTTLPITTVINKTTYVGCIYNSTDTKWDVVVVNTEA